MATQNATVAGALEVSNGLAVLVGSTTVTAKDHMAEITLNRGGVVHVCATSGLHATAGKKFAGLQPLMLSLDRGAVEVKMPATTSDVVMTPDLRFVVASNGPLDLHLRVTRNGDTCVDNRGAGAPTVNVSAQFGDATYELRRGQHVLFEHGNLKEVVDRETSACGCPLEPPVSVAASGIPSVVPATPGSTVATTQAAELHPFPAAISQGLAPESPVPAAPAGTVHAQVSTTLSYEAGSEAGKTASAGTAASPESSVSRNSSSSAIPETPRPENPSRGSPQSGTTVKAKAPLAPAPSSPNIARRIGHFFKRLFGGR